jgi:hypothetical protein
MKLIMMLQFLKQSKKDRLTLRADGKRSLKCHIDAAFALHPDYKRHTGAVTTMEEGDIIYICTTEFSSQLIKLRRRKLKLNSAQWII